MQISKEQLAQVNHQIEALRSAGSFYGKKLAEAGIQSVSSPKNLNSCPFPKRATCGTPIPWA